MSFAPLKHLIDSRRPITYGIVQAGPDTPGGVPYIRPTDMTPTTGVAHPAKLLRTTKEIAGTYKRSRVLPGDVVLSIGPSYGKVMIVPRELRGANLTQGTARLAPAVDVSGRFLYWALQSKTAVDFWDMAVAGATFRALNLGPLMETPTPKLPIQEQRRIADFLDDQVARLDRAIALREKQAALANESFDGYWSAQILGLGDPSSWVPLRRVLRSITDGPFGSSLTSAHYSTSGARVIRLGNLGEAMFRPRDEAFIPMSYYETLMEHAAMPGDLLVAGLGDENHPLGRACLVPPDLGPAIVKADCFRVRLDQQLMDHEFAAWALSSPPVTAETQVVGRGATRARINTVTAREMRLPVPDLATQKEVVVRLRQRRVDVEQAKSALRKSLDLLAERKQALITAAVTGAFDVTTARAVAS